jgi:hypothetical protein
MKLLELDDEKKEQENETKKTYDNDVLQSRGRWQGHTQKSFYLVDLACI